MEYIVGLIALAAVIYLVTRKKEETVAEVQPTKVEEVNAQPVVEIKQEAPQAAPKAKAPAKKPATKAAPKAPAKKPAAPKAKAPAKKPVAKKPKA